MKRDLGVKPFLFPMPVLMVATYGDGDVVDVMNMAWGIIFSARSSACWQTRTFWMRREMSMRKSSTPSSTIRCRAAVTRSEKRRARRGAWAQV